MANYVSRAPSAASGWKDFSNKQASVSKYCNRIHIKWLVKENFYGKILFVSFGIQEIQLRVSGFCCLHMQSLYSKTDFRKSISIISLPKTNTKPKPGFYKIPSDVPLNLTNNLTGKTSHEWIKIKQMFQFQATKHYYRTNKVLWRVSSMKFFQGEHSGSTQWTKDLNSINCPTQEYFSKHT